MKKSIALFILISLLFLFRMVFSNESIKENYLYYYDTNNNNKIDLLEIEFNTPLTGTLQREKLFLYSNTLGLSTIKLDSISGSGIFIDSYLSGNILGIHLQEQDNTLTGLTINNTTSSHLRLKTNGGVGIFDEYGNEIKLLYTSSFNNYNNTAFKQNLLDNTQDTDENTQTGETQTGSILIEENSDTSSGSTDSSSGELISTGMLNEENTQTGETQTGVIVIPENPDSNSGATDTQSGTLISTGGLNEENNQAGTGIQAFTGKILFQSPSYLDGKEREKTQYNCLTTQTDCKVNYNLNINTGSGFSTISSSKYNCEWDFGFGEFLEEKYKCNPNTITYPEGRFITKYKITQIANPDNFFEQTIEISNSGYIEPPVQTKVVYTTRTIMEDEMTLFIDTPKIQIQSGLDENHICKKEDCSINLIYEPKNSKENCLWTFAGGTFDVGTDKKCNPGYIKYPLGDFSVTLKVYQAGKESNFKESMLHFSNKPIIREEREEQNSQIGVSNIFSGLTNTGSYDGLKISKILPNPSGTDHAEYIEIINTSTGKINLKGCELDDKRKGASKPFLIEKDIILDVSTSYKFFKFDTDLSLNNTGGDEVHLICNDTFLDSVSWKYDTPDDFVVTHENALLEEITSFTGAIQKLELHDIIQSQSGSIDEKVVEIINKTFTQKVKKQKKGVKIYGKTFPNSKVMIELSTFQEISFFFPKAFANNQWYETISDEKGNYEFLLQDIQTGEYEIKNYLQIDEKTTLELQITEELEIESEYLEYMSFSKDTLKTDIISYEDTPLKSNITLQNLAKGISVSGNKITCQNMNECNINFDGRASKGDIIEYIWEFGNNQTFTKANPSSMKFSTGKYFISLKVQNQTNEDISYFFLEVSGKASKEKTSVTQNSAQAKNTLLKNEKIDIVPTVYAKDEEKTQTKTQIFMIIFVLVLFLILSFILAKREKLI